MESFHQISHISHTAFLAAVHHDTAEEIAFYTWLRHLVISFLFVIAAYLYAYVYQRLAWREQQHQLPQAPSHIPAEIRYFDRRATASLICPPVLESTLDCDSLSFHLCAFLLATAGLWVVLVFAAVMLSTDGLTIHWLLYWVDPPFVRNCWVGLSWASSSALFFVFPFAFLYDEAEGFLPRSSGGFFSRVIETLVVQSLISVLLCGSFVILQAMLLETGPSDPKTYFSASSLVFQFPGLFIYLAFYFRGLEHVAGVAYSWRVPWTGIIDESELVSALQLESMSLQTALEDALHRRDNPQQTCWAFAISAERLLDDGLGESLLDIDEIRHRLFDVRQRLTETLRRSRRGLLWSVRRNLVSWTCVALALWLPFLLALRAAVQCQSVVVHSLSVLLGFGSSGKRAMQIWRLFLGTRPHPVAELCLNLALVVYVLIVVSTAVLHRFTAYWPSGEPAQTTRSITQQMLVYNSILLLLCSTLPLATYLLGITNFELHNVLPETTIASRQYASLLYCCGFLVLNAVGVARRTGLPVHRWLQHSLTRMARWVCCLHRHSARKAANEPPWRNRVRVR